MDALKALGGSASVQEMYDKVCEIKNFSEEQQSVLQGNGPQTQITYRLAWARTYLKKCGLIESRGRGLWALTEKGSSLSSIDRGWVKQTARVQSQNSEAEAESEDIQDQSDGEGSFPEDQFPLDSDQWVEKLLAVVQGIPPDSFERLCQRILRESGFIKVEVTGKSGDGGIDGIGVLKVGLLSFQVFFQCKRYVGSVGSSAIRDFRGAMVGRTDKGVFLTTGTFTREAKKEATRDGAPALDLIDGYQLCILLRELGLGVKTRTVEVVDIEEGWFSHL